MEIKSVLKGKKPTGKKDSKYPYIGISPDSGRVIVFTDPITGTLIHDPSAFYGVGHHTDSWAEDSFEPLRGEIVLSNGSKYDTIHKAD